MELLKLQNKDNYNQILELRQHIHAQSRWTFYLNHIVEHIMNNLIDAGKKVNLKYNLRKTDDTKTFNNICDNFQQFVDFTLNLYNQVQERGGFEEIDENIKKSHEILTQVESPQFKKAQKADDTIQNLIGKDYNPDDLEQIFSTNQKKANNPLISVADPLSQTNDPNIAADDIKGIDLASQIREEFPDLHNDQEIFEQLVKLKKELNDAHQQLDDKNEELEKTNNELGNTQKELENTNKELNITNQKLDDTNNELESKTQLLTNTHKQIENLAKLYNIELPSLENPEAEDQGLIEEKISKVLEQAKKDKELRECLQKISNNNNDENEEINVEQIKELQENHDKTCQQLQSKSEELEKTKSQLNSILQVLNLNNENNEGPITDDKYLSILEKVKEMNDAARSLLPDYSENSEEVKFSPNNVKSRSIENKEKNLLNDLNKTRGQLHEFADIFSNDKEEKDENKQTNSDDDDENKLYEPINDEEFKPLIETAKKDRDISTSVQQILPEHSSNGEEAAKEIKGLQMNTSNLQNKLRNLTSAIEGIEEPDDQELTDSRIEKDITKIKKENKIMDIIENVLLNPSKEKEEETKLETENQEINKSLISETEPEQVADKLNYLNNRSVELDNVNQTVSSLTQELEQTKQQLENRTNELVDKQKQLKSFYEVAEVIQGGAVNPEDLTPEKLAEIINKAREDKELIDSIELYNKSPHKKNPNSTNSLQSRSQDYFRLIHQLEEFVSIYGPSDENGNKKELQDLDEEDFAKMIEIARNNKKISDTVHSSLSQSSNSTSADEVEKKIKTLETRSNELDRITNQFNQVLHAIGPIKEEESNKTPENNNNNISNQQKQEDTEDNNSGTTKTFNAREISNEELSAFISKAKKSNEITTIVNKHLPEHSSTSEEFENTLIDLKSRSSELDKIVQSFDKVLQAIGSDKDAELTAENQTENQEQEENLHPKSRNISDEELLEVISNARRAKEITKVVETTIPEHSSTAEEVESAINTFKSLSEELEEVSQKLDIKTSEFEKLRNHFNTLFTIYNSNQNDNSEFVNNENLNDTKNNTENISKNSVKYRNVNDEIIEEEEEEYNEHVYSAESTTSTKSNNQNIEKSFNEPNNDSNVDETNKNQENDTSKLNQSFNNENPNRTSNTDLPKLENQLDNLDENDKDQDNKASQFSEHFNNENPNRTRNTGLPNIENQLDNLDENDKDQDNKASQFSEYFNNENPNRTSNTGLPNIENQLDNLDENYKDQDNKTSQFSKHFNNENPNRISSIMNDQVDQVDNHDENESQHHKNDIQSETSNIDDKIEELIEKVKRSKDITTVVESSFPEDSENAEQVDNKIKTLKNQSVQLDYVSQDLEEKSIKLEHTRKQLQEFLKIFGDEENCHIDEIDDEEFAKMIETARNNKKISDTVHSSLSQSSNSSSADEVEKKIKTLETRSNELDRITNQFNQVLHAIGPIKEEESNKTLENENNNNIDDQQKQEDTEDNNSGTTKTFNAREISNEELSAFISKAKKSNEITTIVNKHLPEHSSTSEEFENTLIDLKTRSSELDKIAQSFDKVLQAIQDDKDAELTAENQTENQEQEENLHPKSRNISDEELHEIISNARRAKEITKVVETTIPEHSSTAEEVESAINTFKSLSEELEEVSQKLDIKTSDFEKLRNHFNTLFTIYDSNQNDHETKEEEEEYNEHIFSARTTTKSNNKNIKKSFNEPNNDSKVDETNKDQDNKTSQFSKHFNNENPNKRSIIMNDQLDNHDENDSQHHKNNIQSETSNIDDKIEELIEKVKRSKNITTVVESSFPEDSENAEQVDNKIKTLKNQSVQLDYVSQDLEEKSIKLEHTRKQLQEIIQSFHKEACEQKNIEEMNEEEFTNFIEEVKKEKEIMDLLNKRYDNKGVDIIKIRKTLNDFDRSVSHLERFLKIFDGEENYHIDDIDDDDLNEIINKAKKDSDISLAVKITLPNHSSCSEEVKATVKILKLRSSELDKVRKQLKEFTTELQRVRMQLNSMIFSSFSSPISFQEPNNNNTTNDSASYMDSSFDSHDFLSNNDFAFF